MERNRNITFRRILNTFDTIANKHPEIHGFNSGFMDEVDIQKLGLGDYPLLYVEPSTADFDKAGLYDPTHELPWEEDEYVPPWEEGG